MPFSEVKNNLNEDFCYQASFGNLPNKTTYLDLMAGECKAPIDVRQTEVKAAVSTTAQLYAVGTAYSGTSGSIPVQFPTFVDNKFYDTYKRKTPLASGLLARVTNRGLFADYVKTTAYQTATWNAEGGGTMTSLSTTNTRTAAPMKYMFAIGEVYGPAIVASAAWQNVLQHEITTAYGALKILEEDTIINGDTTSGTYTNGFNGLIKSITTNTTNKSAELLLSDIDTALQKIREARGTPNLMVTDWRTYNRIAQMIRPILTAPSGQALIDFGFDAITYQGIPIIPDLAMPTTAAARELLVLDTQTEQNIQIRVLQEATYVEMAKTADSVKFFIAAYLTMIIINEAWCHRIYNLT